MKRDLKYLITASFLVLCTFSFGAPPEPQPEAPPPAGFPIDAPLFILMIVGIVFVIVYFNREQKRKKLED
jgi:hypothetical protein